MEDLGPEAPPLSSGEAEPPPHPAAAADLLVVLCRFLGVWYAEVSSDRYVTRLCSLIPKLCGDGDHWAGRPECRMRGLALLLPALAPLAERPAVADALVAAGVIEQAALMFQQVLAASPHRGMRAPLDLVSLVHPVPPCPMSTMAGLVLAPQPRAQGTPVGRVSRRRKTSRRCTTTSLLATRRRRALPRLPPPCASPRSARRRSRQPRRT